MSIRIKTRPTEYELVIDIAHSVTTKSGKIIQLTELSDDSLNDVVKTTVYQFYNKAGRTQPPEAVKRVEVQILPPDVQTFLERLGGDMSVSDKLRLLATNLVNKHGLPF